VEWLYTNKEVLPQLLICAISHNVLKQWCLYMLINLAEYLALFDAYTLLFLYESLLDFIVIISQLFGFMYYGKLTIFLDIVPIWHIFMGKLTIFLDIVPIFRQIFLDIVPIFRHIFSNIVPIFRHIFLNICQFLWLKFWIKTV